MNTVTVYLRLGLKSSHQFFPPHHLFLLDDDKVGLAAEVEGLPTPGTLEHRYVTRLLMQILKIRTIVIIIMGY